MRKKDIQKLCENFVQEANEIVEFIQQVRPSKGPFVDWVYDHAIIRLYRSFENLMLNCLVGALNRDTQQLSEKKGFPFPKHLTDEVCEYLVVGDGYFDFKGRDGLIHTLKKYLADNSFLVEKVRKSKYKEPLDHLFALRNFAAHGSKLSKERAKKALNSGRMLSSGKWLKTQERFEKIVRQLQALANEIGKAAPR